MRLFILALAVCWGLFLGQALAANDWQRSPWLVDTAGASPIAGGIAIQNIRWTAVGSPGDTLIITDTTGRRILTTVAPAGGSEYELSLPFDVNKGIVINRIDSGVLYLYFR